RTTLRTLCTAPSREPRSMPRSISIALAALFLSTTAPLHGQEPRPCAARTPDDPLRPAKALQLRCRYGVVGPGRFGLLSYADVPVYQPATPMPGTHVVGIPGHAHPLPGESHEAWEWRVLRTEYGPDARRVHRELEVLDPTVAARIMRLES